MTNKIRIYLIFEKDYKNFIDLIKNNNRFKTFLSKNHLLLHNAKELFDMNKAKDLFDLYINKTKF